VRRALDCGRITAEPGGIDAARADREWQHTTAPRVLTPRSDHRPAPSRVAAPAVSRLWAPTEAQRKRWGAWRRELNAILTGLSKDSVWEGLKQLGPPIPRPTGSPRLDAFLDAWDDVCNAVTDLDKALQQYAYASTTTAADEEG
jgi:hypothetical protein